MAIGENTIVKINYKGTLEDGSVFDTSEGREPLEFIFGMGMIIPGLEKGLNGLNVGDKKSVNVPHAEAYGPVMEQAIQEVPKTQFPADMELKEGMQLAAQGPQGVIPVLVKEVKDETVVVDFNHPLAGKDLTFDVEVVEVKEATEDEKKRILEPLMAAHGHSQEDGCAGCAGGDCSDKENCGQGCDCVPNSEESLEDALEEKNLNKNLNFFNFYFYKKF